MQLKPRGQRCRFLSAAINENVPEVLVEVGK